ncbi:MAG: TrmH family RNA methyltransferase [Armatimonadota bacterium]
MNDTLNTGNFCNSFHVILVEPADSLNVGAVARAMMNLGFRHLHLVDPLNYDRPHARVTARRADPLLESMVFHDTFEQAIADMDEVVGLALRSGERPAHFVTLPQWTNALPDKMGSPEETPRKIALVFGPENSGLRNEHLDQCRWVIRIPSTEEFSAFNLAQSVLLVLYDISRVLSAELPHEPLPVVPPENRRSARKSPAIRPTWNEYFQLDRHLDGVMAETGFVREGSPQPVPALLKSLFRRLELTPQEMGILLAFFARIHAMLRRGGVPGESEL